MSGASVFICGPLVKYSTLENTKDLFFFFNCADLFWLMISLFVFFWSFFVCLFVLLCFVFQVEDQLIFDVPLIKNEK